MKKTIKFSVIVMCAVLLLASCTAPDSNVPGNQAPGLSEIGGTVNKDGSVTLESGIVIAPDGSITGEISPDGSITTASGKTIQSTTDIDETSVKLIDKAIDYCTGGVALKPYLNETESENGIFTTLKKEVTVDGMTVKNLAYTGSATQASLFVVFSDDMDGNKKHTLMHTYTEDSAGCIFDGKVLDWYGIAKKVDDSNEK